MVDALTKALNESKGLAAGAHQIALREKDAGVLGGIMSMGGGMSALGSWQNEARYRERYNLFHGTLYAAINAIAHEAAGQEPHVGRTKIKEKKKGPKGSKTIDMIRTKNGHYISKKSLPARIRTKAANDELEILENHQLMSTLSQPNPIQGGWQFVYSFMANLLLTGWSYVVGGVSEETNELEYYSLPTTWIKPDHTDGPFSKFRIVNPRNPTAGADEEPLTRDNVAFAYLPNPADPLSALAPAAAQMMAIRIEDNIWTSREQLFGNGIFPSVIITVGKDPHPDVPAGLRPRLTGGQRRQVYTAIRKVMGGVANYGSPAIVDGLIEKIERLSMSATEMGWEKSEPAVKAAILSTFCVHPFILGEGAPGSYAQMAIVSSRFNKRVNTYLMMLGNLMTNFCGGHLDDEDLLVWWDECEDVDPTRRDAMWRFARQNNDVSQNEFRAEMGLGPDEDRNESLLDKGLLGGLVQLLSQAGQGAVQPVQLEAILIGLGLPSDLAKKISGKGIKQTQALQQATGELQQATQALQPKPGEVETVAEEEAKKLAIAILEKLSR